MKYFLIILALTGLTGCAAAYLPVGQPLYPAESKPITAVGYGVPSQFKNYPAAQKKLLAIRAAKLDAYRNLAEELYGVRLRGTTTVKDMAVENDSYRTYVDTMIRGAHLISVLPKGDDVYEAEVELRIPSVSFRCLSYPTRDCLQVAPAYMAPSCGTDCVREPVMTESALSASCPPDCAGTVYPQVETYY